MKVLYAEDELALSMAVAEILKMEGFTVEAVHNGTDALDAAKKHSFDVIILDIMMPGMDGIEVLKNIRAGGDFTPVILLTAKTTVDDRIEGLGSGADDYLAKPFAMGELVARVNACIRRSQKYRRPEIAIANVRVDMDSNRLYTDMGELVVSAKETELLELLIKRGTDGTTQNEIMELIWPDEKDDNTAILYLTYLKNKLRQIHSDVSIIREGDSIFLR